MPEEMGSSSEAICPTLVGVGVEVEHDLPFHGSPTLLPILI